MTGEHDLGLMTAAPSVVAHRHQELRTRAKTVYNLGHYGSPAHVAAERAHAELIRRVLDELRSPDR